MVHSPLSPSPNDETTSLDRMTDPSMGGIRSSCADDSRSGIRSVDRASRPTAIGDFTVGHYVDDITSLLVFGQNKDTDYAGIPGSEDNPPRRIKADTERTSRSSDEPVELGSVSSERSSESAIVKVILIDACHSLSPKSSALKRRILVPEVSLVERRRRLLLPIGGTTRR
jgi:hypothetical protein